MKMELLVIFTSLCICLSMLVTPCAGFQTEEQPSHKGQGIGADEMHSLPTLPRKLRVLLDKAALPAAVKGHGGQVSTSNNKQKRDLSGKAHHGEESMINASRGTRQEWAEGTDTSQFLTMDYSHVRRRRPIHNKSLPVGP
ncbi:protein GOLVEN 6 [Ricinus communis]|uniref:protein GOLVEN 6 n=1 Tax=Ricinus communis TaxID=3988 RepID=UPI000D69C11A|nr:protein GOLVEN 6 [Ricinus communis]|eukprot:XP_015571994.2 probable root meristem growth factor 8 [Ricinus communis]